MSAEVGRLPRLDDDEPTTRIDLEATLLAQRTMLAPPAEQTPLVTMSAPLGQRADRPTMALSRQAKVGIGLFVLGVLVGAGGASWLLANGAAPPLVASRHPSRVAAPPATVPAPLPFSEPPPPAVVAARPLDAPAAKPTQRDPPDASEPSLAALPVSSSSAPSCQELLGEPPVKRQSSKAAARETLMGKRQLTLGNVAMAQAAYCNALALDRSNADRHVNLARLYLVRRDWKKAAELGQSALELDPKNRAALGVLSDSWAGLHQSEQAKVAMLAAEGKPQATERELRTLVRRNLALANRVARLNDFLLAERLYRRVLLVDPSQAEAVSGVARCLLKAGDFRAAESWALHAKELKSGQNR